MLLQFTTSIAAARWSYRKGDVIEVDHMTSQFSNWLKVGIVVIVQDGREPAPIETGLSPEAPEHALSVPGRRSRRRRATAD